MCTRRGHACPGVSPWALFLVNELMKVVLLGTSVCWSFSPIFWHGLTALAHGSSHDAIEGVAGVILAPSIRAVVIVDMLINLGVFQERFEK